MSRIVVLGDLNLDVLAALPEVLPVGGEVRSQIQVEPGGSAGNFARAAARAGARVTFIGCVGGDLVGDLLIRSLEDQGIEVQIKRVDRRSGTIISLVNKNGKTILCSRGANDGLDPSWIREDLFRDADHVHISGYSLLSTSQREAAHRAIEIARSLELTISIDPPPANLIRSFGVPAFLAEIAAADLIFPNLAEGRVLAGEENEEAIVATLAVRFPMGALTLGEEGSLAWCRGERARCAGGRIAGIDTTGAGDAFAAGFVISYLEDRDLSLANQQGNEAALSVLATRDHTR
jgi:sugar/nucleoside kinase (ribokinase family)